MITRITQHPLLGTTGYGGAERPLFGLDARVEYIDATTFDIDPRWPGVDRWAQNQAAQAIRDEITRLHGPARGLPYE